MQKRTLHLTYKDNLSTREFSPHPSLSNYIDRYNTSAIVVYISRAHAIIFTDMSESHGDGVCLFNSCIMVGRVALDVHIDFQRELIHLPYLS